jgi:predicted nicotinamide N-methyase
VPNLESLVRAALNAPESIGGDGVRLVPAPLVPEVRLFIAEDAIVLWARLEAEAGRPLPPPYWASAWSGGQALARYILDHPATVAGRRVLDLASGSGLVAIAAALAGAAAVTANDVDPYAVASIAANAAVNGVDVACSVEDMLDDDGTGLDLVLAGDVLYNPTVAGRMLPYLRRVAERGGEVLVGDPGRGHVSHEWLVEVATYAVPGDSAPEDTQLPSTSVLRPREAGPVSLRADAP